MYFYPNKNTQFYRISHSSGIYIFYHIKNNRTIELKETLIKDWEAHNIKLCRW